METVTEDSRTFSKKCRVMPSVRTAQAALVCRDWNMPTCPLARLHDNKKEASTKKGFWGILCKYYSHSRTAILLLPILCGRSQLKQLLRQAGCSESGVS